MNRKHESYGGFQPLELRDTGFFYSENEYNLLKFNSAKVGIGKVIEKNQIEKMYVPFYLCPNVCKEIEGHDLEVVYYNIDKELLPIINDEFIEGDWIYIVDYFGIMDNRLDVYIKKHSDYKYIVDNCHSFFHKPNVGENYIYSCKKFFGVPDGSYLITDDYIEEQGSLSKGAEYSNYLITALESGTNYCYNEKKKVDDLLGRTYDNMSIIADKIMRSIDYEMVINIRRENAAQYERAFSEINRIKIEKNSVPYMYPLNFGQNIKKELIGKKIFVPTLWEQCKEEKYKETWEYDLTENTLFLPVDQRYDKEDVEYVISIVKSLM